MELFPKKCNLCGGDVIYASNARIYGKTYGSGMMYYCTKCGAYVGTHKPRPREALGILANEEMRVLKRTCHDLFDQQWLHEQTSKERNKARRKAYRMLAKKLNISVEDCHFGYFDTAMLYKAYEILKRKEEVV